MGGNQKKQLEDFAGQLHIKKCTSPKTKMDAKITIDKEMSLPNKPFHGFLVSMLVFRSVFIYDFFQHPSSSAGGGGLSAIP